MKRSLVPALLCSLLAACTTLPTGPSVMALPGSGKSFDQFRRDDVDCRDYASFQIGGTSANQAALDAGLKSAAVGTVVGAVAGAAMGGHDGVGAGAGTGLVMGSMVGAGAGEGSARGTQQHYDHAYIQCMYAKGQRVPVPAGYVSGPAGGGAASPSRPGDPAYYPPPPASPGPR
ncbi:MAG: glycine zipper family protein [Rhodocyclaceae bacterium]|nr:glycine zipper family protein [Rhodocyclaceae bacterium]